MDTNTQAGTAAGTELDKETWITRAAARIAPYLGDGSREYAKSLYETYVKDYGDDWAQFPEDAVDEDLTYWDADE